MMKIKNKQILRKSIVDGKLYPLNELIRFAKLADGSIKFDPNCKLSGRGAYCYKNISQLDILFKKRLLNKSFRHNISIEEYNEIRKDVDEWIKNKIKENQTMKE
ncbi:YlxR family protein [Metamycoplasma hyosynoviae]|nr:YlxR family protein [Metamycoplasma hyosynoviae]